MSSKNIPEITPIEYNNTKIFKLSFIPLLVLNNTANPTPAPTRSPEIKVEAVIKFSKYICVNITDAAQFGISPIKPAITGPIIGLFSAKLAIASSPIKCIIRCIIIDIINMYIKIFIVCFKEDFNILFSQ